MASLKALLVKCSFLSNRSTQLTFISYLSLLKVVLPNLGLEYTGLSCIIGC